MTKQNLPFVAFHLDSGKWHWKLIFSQLFEPLANNLELLVYLNSEAGPNK
jgi:hypothetical protein